MNFPPEQWTPAVSPPPRDVSSCYCNLSSALTAESGKQSLCPPDHQSQQLLIRASLPAPLLPRWSSTFIHILLTQPVHTFSLRFHKRFLKAWGPLHHGGLLPIASNWENIQWQKKTKRNPVLSSLTLSNDYFITACPPHIWQVVKEYVQGVCL